MTRRRKVRLPPPGARLSEDVYTFEFPDGFRTLSVVPSELGAVRRLMRELDRDPPIGPDLLPCRHIASRRASAVLFPLEVS